MLIKNNYLLVFIRVLSISETINTLIKNFSGQLHWLSCLTRSKKKMFVFLIRFANKYFILKSMKLIPSQAISIKPLLNRRLEPFLKMYLQINQYLSSKIQYSSFSVKEIFCVCFIVFLGQLYQIWNPSVKNLLVHLYNLITWQIRQWRTPLWSVKISCLAIIMSGNNQFGIMCRILLRIS